MKKHTNMKGQVVKLSVVDERNLKATAYAKGTMNEEIAPDFDFQVEYWQKGRRDDSILREEIKKGLR